MSGFCPVSFFCPSGIADGVASTAAQAVFAMFSKSMTSAADWFVGQVIEVMKSTTTVQVGAHWFDAQLDDMAQVAALVVLPILVVATIGPVLHQDIAKLGRVWCVGLPIALFSGLAVPFVVSQMLSVTDSLCGYLAGGEGSLARQFAHAMTSPAAASVPQFAQVIVAAVAVVGALCIWFELILRSAAVYLATFFMPLVLVGYIWPATARMTRRAVEILASLILSKLVVVGAVVLGIGALGHGADPLLSGAAILLLAAFAPFALFRLAPIVEAQAIGHLEGLARRPVRAAAGAATTAAGAPNHPVTRLLMSGLKGGGSQPQSSGVTEQAIPFAVANFKTSGDPLTGRPREGGEGAASA